VTEVTELLESTFIHMRGLKHITVNLYTSILEELSLLSPSGWVGCWEGVKAIACPVPIRT